MTPIEAAARAIAANKRGVPADNASVDRAWQSYVGQARACIAAYADAVPTPANPVFRAIEAVR